MFFVYILYSSAIDKYYIGQTHDVLARVLEHNTGFYENSYTSKTNDWEIKLQLECNTRTRAIKIESYIKKMKNRSYIEKLISDSDYTSYLFHLFSE